MLINAEAMVIITSHASPGEKGWDEVEDRSRVESLAAFWKHSKDG